METRIVETSPPPVPGGRPVLLVPGLGSPSSVPQPAARRVIAPNATVAARIDLTPAIARFRIRPDAGVPAFQPGQYFALGLEVEGRFVQRPYSTASPAGRSDELEFLVRRVAAGIFTPALWQVGPGERIWIGPPKGLFVLQPGDQRAHLFVSTGTGLAPFISMAESLLRAGHGPRMIVVHGASYASELAYRDLLESWASGGRLAYEPTISRPADPANAGWSGLVGRTENVLTQVRDSVGLDPLATVAYLCGNPDMIASAAATLAGLGLPDEAIIREHYWTAATA
jgi:ferredoxin--NADP+ reductase